MIVTRELVQAQSEQPDIGQPQPAVTMQERLFNEMLDSNREMHADNCNLLEFKYAAIEFIIEQGLAQDNEDAEQLIQTRTGTRREHPNDLERELAQARQLLDQEQRRRVHIWNDYQHFKEWIITLFHNKTIPVSSKIVLLLFYILFHGETGKEQHITMKELADVTGYDEGTDRKACDKLNIWDIIDRRYEDLVLEDGTKYSKGMVYFTLSPVVATPEYIRMENNHGGERERKCSNPNCRSTALDNYTVRHCRDCKESEWYGQPGTRDDADLKAAQNGHIVAIERRRRNNQDASSLSHRVNTSITVVDSQLTEIETANPVGQLPGRTDVTQLTASTNAPELEPKTRRQDEQTVTETCISGNNQDAFTANQYQPPIIDEETERASQRYNAALNLLGQLVHYGYQLEFLPDGLRNLKRVDNTTPVPTKAVISRLKQSIKEYDHELRELAQEYAEGEQAIAQAQETPASQDEKQDACDDPQPASSSDSNVGQREGQGTPQLDAQRIPLPSTASCKGLGVRCDICHYNEAIRIWKAGKCYCQACQDKETLS
jgi:hypothetical protein